MAHTNHSFHTHGETDFLHGNNQSTFIKLRRLNTDYKLIYRLYLHQHPYIAELVQRLIERSVKGLQDADTEYVTVAGGKKQPVLFKDFFEHQYQISPPVLSEEGNQPVNGIFIDGPLPVKDLDFTSSGAYSVYNWELFYHVPLTIAIHLSRNQRFEEAQQWFHYLFNPTDSSDEATPQRFWKVKPFQSTDVAMIEEILLNLSTNEDSDLYQQTFNCINAWKEAPFRPHIIARYRPSAYMFKTVMAYLDNLIAWGDSLFRQDTGESINEAIQIYVLAAYILGPRPQKVPSKGTVKPRTYANLRKDLSSFNALVELESAIPFDIAPYPGNLTDDDKLINISSIGKTLYFSIPRNDKLVTYWDTVADRLFKIRNSLNLQGIFRQLPLFDPPIDPAVLARAAAAGVDVGAVVSGANQPLPLVRFVFLIQKAAEICQEVKSLGNSLLTAIEKEDNEALSLLRAKHEGIILGITETVKYSQLQEAIKNREGLEKNLENACQRYIYFERLLGKEDNEIKIPELEELDSDSLIKMKFKAVEPAVEARSIDYDIVRELSGDMKQMKLSSREADEMQKLKSARKYQEESGDKERLGSILAFIPDLTPDIKFWGIGVGFSFGGSLLSKAMSLGASFDRSNADKATYDAGQTSKLGSYSRREQEWTFQSNLAAGEITQIFKQIRAAQIREAIAEREWQNHKQQIRNSEDIENFLNGEEVSLEGWKHKKTSTQALYTWMKREVKGLYGQYFQFAFDIARKAERALQYELGDTKISYLQFGYLAGKEGLLAGEKLHMDIKRLEMAYHDLNQREYELTKHISILQVNPEALVQLRSTGTCSVILPEELFDLDCPGHYFRRIKSIAVSIPCVAGPYTSINCKLTLLKSSIRVSPIAGEDGYAGTGAEDPRFNMNYSSLQAIVTSTAQNDSGMFETNLRDERYLPFEGSGVISEWQLELPFEIPQFDYNTITDVVLNLRYTSREGGELLKTGAVENLKVKMEEAQVPGTVRLFSVRHEFPTEWARFKGKEIKGEIQSSGLTLELRKEHYPYWLKGKIEKGQLDHAEIYARPSIIENQTKTIIKLSNIPDINNASEDNLDQLTEDATLGGLRAGRLTKNLPSSPIGSFTIYLDDNSMEDLWLVIAWRGSI